MKLFFTKPIIFILFLNILVFISGCKKKHDTLPSSKEITSFVFKAADNSGLTADIKGTITADSVKLYFSKGIIITNLVPVITHSGKSISPASKDAGNFSVPVHYTVTAEDGSMKVYTIVCFFLSNNKNITSFIFKATGNPGLASDVTGEVGTDTIIVNVPSAISLSNLTPVIIHTGVSISPQSNVAQDFSGTVNYMVTAEDGTFKIYKVILSANVDIYIGSDDGNIYAINAANGTVRWKYGTGGKVQSSPAVVNGILYAGSQDGYLYAINITTKTLKWRYNTNAPITISSPMIVNGTVYISNTHNPPGTGEAMFAIDATAGTLIWKYQFSLPTSPLVINGNIYIGDLGSGLYCLDAATGILKWRYNAGIVRGSPAAVNGVLYSGGEGEKILALNLATGTLIWNYYDGNIGSGTSPCVDNGSVYISGYDGYLYSFDASAGTLKWRIQTTDLNGGPFYNPIAYNDMVYAGNGDSYFYAIDVSTGTVKWRYRMGDVEKISTVSPAVANGIIYVGASNNNIYALDATTGALKWKCVTNGPVVSGPCITDFNGNTFYPAISGHQN